jgi:ADP-heptose:LPS heptosyltransferase
MQPQHILLIKAHSMGIGDLLRSSAAWLAIKRQWPNVQLHLLMLSKNEGYPSEDFIRGHHLLNSAHFVTINERAEGERKLPFKQIVASIEKNLGELVCDLVIDCEPYGLRTSLITKLLARKWKTKSVGVAQFPLRRFFYDVAAPSLEKYAGRHQLSIPMDYTERDFVVLAALGIAREGASVNLEVSQQGLAWQARHVDALKHKANHLPNIVLNIGCGTPDAIDRRPDLNLLAKNFLHLYQRMPYTLHLSGAAFERETNAAFVRLLQVAAGQSLPSPRVVDWAGQCSLSELTGLLAAGDLVVSSDSGPYHMAVALGIPAVCWFNFDNPAAVHHGDRIRVLVTPQQDAFSNAVMNLMPHYAAR